MRKKKLPSDGLDFASGVDELSVSSLAPDDQAGLIALVAIERVEQIKSQLTLGLSDNRILAAAMRRQRRLIDEAEVMNVPAPPAVDEAQIRADIASARAEIAREAEQDMESARAMVLQRYHRLYALGVTGNDLRTALLANIELAKAYNVASAVKPDDKDGARPYAALNDAELESAILQLSQETGFSISVSRETVQRDHLHIGVLRESGHQPGHVAERVLTRRREAPVAALLPAEREVYDLSDQGAEESDLETEEYGTPVVADIAPIGRVVSES